MGPRDHLTQSQSNPVLLAYQHAPSSGEGSPGCSVPLLTPSWQALWGIVSVHLCPCTRDTHLVFDTTLTGANMVASLKCSAQNRQKCTSPNYTAYELFGQQNR